MKKLIITVTPNPSWIYPETRNHPGSPEEMADTVYECYKAGASIAHLHAAGTWDETSKLIREKCDILLQFGLSGDSIEVRKQQFALKPDMISVMLTHHDEQFTREAFNVLHLKEELEEYCRLCNTHGVKPEFEVWHSGALWNLRYLAARGLLKQPYFLSLFFGWPGGSWSAPTPGEYLHRLESLPDGSVSSTSVMGPEQTRLLVFAIGMGGHVRVGTEDYPYLQEGMLAKDNAELVSRIARVAREMGREIADPPSTRSMLGLDEV